MPAAIKTGMSGNLLESTLARGYFHKYVVKRSAVRPKNATDSMHTQGYVCDT
jgi:hypothetical protein